MRGALGGDLGDVADDDTGDEVEDTAGDAVEGDEDDDDEETRSCFGEGGCRSYSTRCASLTCSKLMRSNGPGACGSTAVLCFC